MPVSIPDFWKLVLESRLLTAEQCQKLGADFGQVKGAADQGNAKTLGEWLVTRNALSRYQNTVLQAGRAGPFYYGDYRVYDRVESGSLAGQFRAIHAPTGHPAMLRFLTGAVTKDQREWAAVAARVVKQAGVIYPLLQRYFEPVDLQAFKFVATEDVRGETLDEVLAKKGRLAPQEAARIIRHAAFALAYLHQVGIIHGEIRPQHLLLEPNGNVKLMVDPTIVQGPVQVAQIDPNSPLAVKADYLAPEFMQAGKSPDELTDIYALGCTFYQLLTGQPPFPGGLPGQKLARHAAERIQPLDPYGVPQPLGQLVAFMMAKNPASRYQHATIVAEQLSPFVDPAQLQIPSQSPPPTLAAFENWIKQKQAVLASAPVKAVTSTPAGGTLPNLNTSGAEATKSPAGPTIVSGAPTKATARLHRPRKQNMPLMVGGGVAVAALLLVIVLVIAGSGGGDEDSEVAKKSTPTKSIHAKKGSDTPPIVDKKKNQDPPVVPNNDKKPPAETTVDPPTTVQPVAIYDVMPDDGKLLWASPTQGSELLLDFVPPNVRILIAVRPAALLSSASGPEVLQALGPEFVGQRATWEKAAGVKLEQVEQLVVALHHVDGQPPIASYRVTLATPIPEADLVRGFGNPTPKDASGTKYYEGAGNAYYVPAAQAGKVFVMGTAVHIKEAAEAKGAPPVLQREMNQLRQVCDADRHLSVIFAPKYLFGDGQAIWSGPYQKLRSPLDWLIGDDVKATLVSLNFGETFYTEVKMVADIDSRNALAGELQTRLEEVPGHVEKYIVSLNAPEYWRTVAYRYPGWIRFLHRQTRVGLEDDIAVMNAALPGSAAPNLILGGELALMSTPGVSVAKTDNGGGKPALPKNLDELLKRKIDFEVPQNDLNLVMADLETEMKTDLPGLPFDFTIKILGKDLEMDGITRNQKILNFKVSAMPLEEVLTGLVRKANPVTTVKDPSELDQKLLWVVGPDPDQPDKQTILITTRKAAEAKKYTLPAPFVPK